MGHHYSAFSRCACGPGTPGEFEFLPYSRAEDEASRESDRKPTLGGEEALLARHVPRVKTRSDVVFLVGALRASDFFKKLEKDQVDGLVDSMKYYEFQMGDVIQREGSVGTHFYVAHGTGLEVVLRGIVVSSLSTGRTFGESSLLQKCPHSCSVVAARKSGVWAAESQPFRQAIVVSVMQEVAEVRAFLEKVPVLQALSSRELDCVADMCMVKTYAPGEFPARADSELNHAILVKDGQLKRHASRDQQEKLLGPGDCIGERLLLYGDKSGVTVQTTQRCELVLLNVRRMRQLIGKKDAAIRLQQFKLKSDLLTSLSEADELVVADIAKSLELSEYLPGAKIPGSIGLFIVLDGDVQAGERPSLRVLREGHVEIPPAAQGADHLLLGSAHDCLLVAGHFGCRLAVLPQQLRTDDAGMKARVFDVLSRVSIFRQVQEATLDALFHCVKTQIYREGEDIVKQGDKGSHFYVIAGGEVEMVKDGNPVKRLVQGGCFGERAVRFEEAWPASFKMATSEGEVWIWDSANLIQVLAKEPRASEQLAQRALLQDPRVKLSDLRKLGQVGTGTSGTVWLVRHTESDARYALKRMEKGDEGEVPPEVQREIDILSENDHPFLMHMVKALETSRRIYVLAEYVGGGELYAAMRSINTVFSRSQAMFYAGSILLMVDALHERNIVYRDLKPENILLDGEGYLKLVDFGTAKKLDSKCGRTFTLVGTTHYMAPEVMRDKGYGLEVDVWALGILIYELLCGQLPFGENAENDREVCRAVLAGKPKISKSLEDASQRILVRLLEPRPRRRLGCGTSGMQEIKDHPFFAPSNSNGNGDEGKGKNDDFFIALVSRKLDPPIKPAKKELQEKDEALSECGE